MDIKSYVRRGIIGESTSYEEIINYANKGNSIKPVAAILEGKGRRKIKLTPKRLLYENYFEGSFIGVEDILIEKSREGAIGVFPGVHYIIWDNEDFMNAIRLNPPLMWRTIDSLSRRIRIYDQKQRYIPQNLQSFDENIENNDLDSISSSLLDSLYQLSFSEENEFPPHILEKLSIPIKKGEYVLKQGDNTRDIYIILSGQAKIIQHTERNSEEIDIVSQGNFIGEMSMFDGLPRSADVVADSDLLLLKFDSHNFHLIFELHFRWSMKILTNLAERIEQRRKELESVPIDSIYQMQMPNLDQ